MNQGIEELRKRFTDPSPTFILENPTCRICWVDYSTTHPAVALPCSYVFGENCILTWARGRTEAGAHNGCSFCQAELLPQTVPMVGARVRKYAFAIGLIITVYTVVRILYNVCRGPKWSLLTSPPRHAGLFEFGFRFLAQGLEYFGILPRGYVKIQDDTLTIFVSVAEATILVAGLFMLLII